MPKTGPTTSIITPNNSVTSGSTQPSEEIPGVAVYCSTSILYYQQSRLINLNSSNDSESDSDDSQEPEKPPLNTVDQLGKGILMTTNKKTEFTILIVGETGTGKTTVLSLIANVLKGHSPSEYEKFYEESNEAGGSQKGSQTNNAKLYEFSSTNGIRVRILDTPGLADTRGIRLDEQHKESIAREIQNKITAINAVIILANGTVPRLGVATDYTLSTLSSMFPTSLANNISFLFTNVSSPLNWNFEVESLPDVLRNNPVYLLDNPVAMQEKYVKEKQKGKAEGKVNKSLIRSLKKTVEEGHKKALGELVKIFDWIDTLSAQPTRGILTLYNQSQTIEMKIANALATMDQMTERKQVLQTIERESDGTKLTMEQYKQFQSTLRQKVYKRIDTTYHNTLCLELKCYNNCHEHCDLDFSLDPERLRGCVAYGGSERMQECRKCKHRYENHRHYHARWELTEDVQTTIDEEAKKKYEDAADKNERQKRRMKQLKNTIEDLDKALANATSEVGELVDEYAKLSLSGSFAGQVKKSVALLDSHLETMRGNGTDAETIKSVEKSLKLMEGKLKLVENAKAPGKNLKAGEGWGPGHGLSGWRGFL